MLLCRGCSTRYESGRSLCPSCGRPAKTHAVDMSSDSGSSLPPALPPPPDEPDEPGEIDAPAEREGVEVELDDAVIDEPEDEIEKEEAPLPAPKRSKTVTRKPAAPALAPVVARRAPRPAPPTLSLDPGQVRALLAEQPGMVEKGLGVHSDASGRQVGVDFETPVGDIDLLARDARGGFVIILVPDHDDPDLVPGLLRRMGWVRKHLCKS
ncbi:MAG TPA: hypothetical protein VMS55_12320, partial [Myxococcota bacterium]|nr:hypothetical protein [Myxococcota bacterium]